MFVDADDIKMRVKPAVLRSQQIDTMRVPCDCTTRYELALVRDDVHRALEEKDTSSLEIATVWLEFLARLADAATLTAPDSCGSGLGLG